MGNFYTTVQILDNEKLGSKRFTEKFCKKMADEGYVSCGGDEAEQSYILHFAENSSWVAIASEEYTSDGQKARADALRFAKLLKAPCVNTNVIDSDCAVMDVYGATGKKLDTLIMGRADDYFGDDYPAPSEKIWGMFLADGTTWERFMEVRNGDYTFVEDGLAELAPLIGMDSCNIGFTSEDAIADDDTVFLYFKSAGKKPKKLTLNAAFKQIFGQALEPLGFQLTKGKYPYFVRVINDEILHVITIRSVSAGFPDYGAFELYGGVATIYRNKIDLAKSPRENLNWLNSTITFYHHAYPDKDLRNSINTISYKKDESESISNGIEYALMITEKYILPVISQIDSIDLCIDYFSKTHSTLLSLYDELENFGNDNPNNDCNEGLLHILKGNYETILEEYELNLESVNYNIQRGTFYTQDDYEKIFKRYNLIKEKNRFVPELFFSAFKELERRKKFNIDELKKYGIKY